LIEGLVLGGTNNQFEVECLDGQNRLCPIKGKVLKESEGYYNALAPGDRVNVMQDELEAGRGQIVSLLPRTNHFVRFNQKGNAPQLIAANLDLLVIVTTPDEPPFRPRFVDRALIQADAEHITPLVLVNKLDLGVDPDTQDRLTDWARLGYEVMTVSAKTGEGMDEFIARIAGRVSAFVGQSGVGKSSLLNALDERLLLRTGGLSEKYGRGTHTTTKGMLFHLPPDPDGNIASIIDTPGVRRFVLHDIPAKDLVLYFREMEPLVGQCSWGLSCSHDREPGCKILEAVYAGVIHEERYESWQRIREEIETGSVSD
jgi:ribosome biogenesis GTPase / thiamine phosphate phosphatase